jgi:hypothetical protein
MVARGKLPEMSKILFRQLENNKILERSAGWLFAEMSFLPNSVGNIVSEDLWVQF